jgi:hypothetical protein
MTIRLATRDDIPALMALESRHHIGNLDPPSRSEGFISILHPEQWFNWAVDCDGVHVGVAENPLSLHAVTTKLGATALTTFDVNATHYHLLAFNF